MPLIEVSLLAGRSPELKQKLIEKLTEATVEALGSKPESISVILRDVQPHDWAKGGITLGERKKSQSGG
ncbi:MAG: tautomerase family protein [Pseudooceanicola sp.]|nr:tautomerase family protein [Pseudooceanicola sp.]